MRHRLAVFGACLATVWFGSMLMPATAAAELPIHVRIRDQSNFVMRAMAPGRVMLAYTDNGVSASEYRLAVGFNCGPSGCVYAGELDGYQTKSRSPIEPVLAANAQGYLCSWMNDTNYPQFYVSVLHAPASNFNSGIAAHASNPAATNLPSGYFLLAFQFGSAGEHDVGGQLYAPPSQYTPSEPQGAGYFQVQAPGEQVEPRVAAVGSNSWIMAWLDRAANGTSVHAQCLDWTTPRWPGGVVIESSPSDKVELRILPDGIGGAIVGWKDASDNVKLQRIGPDGANRWGAEGWTMPFHALDSYAVVSDGAGGAFVAWSTYRGYGDIRCQRLDSLGTAIWGASGVTVCGLNGNQDAIQMVADGTGGVVMTWEDGRVPADLDIYAQRLGPTGNALWSTNGIAVCTAPHDQMRPQIVSDGSTGTVIAWEDHRSGDIDLYAQWVDSAGRLVPEVEVEPEDSEPATSTAVKMLSANPSAMFQFQLNLAEESKVELLIFDASGRRVRTVLSGRFPAGPRDAVWDGHDDAGHSTTAGVYFARTALDGVVSETRLVRIE